MHVDWIWNHTRQRKGCILRTRFHYFVSRPPTRKTHKNRSERVSNTVSNTRDGSLS